jgi:hypothetical protein
MSTSMLWLVHVCNRRALGSIASSAITRGHQTYFGVSQVSDGDVGDE